MLKPDEVENLAKLARISLTDDEKKTLESELKSILGYVDQLNEVSEDMLKRNLPKIRNVFRDDKEPHESGKFSEEILNLAPKEEKNYIKVKKIL